MLCEFALTPHIFDDVCNSGDPDWKEHLRELGRSMFPRNAASPIIISDLYDGSWQHEFKATIEAIEDESAKDLAQSFMSMIIAATVPRPAIGDYPYDDEDAWAREAMATNSVEALKRIVVTDQAYPTVQACGPVAVKLSEVALSACWDGVVVGRALQMDIAVQVAALRPMLIHADFIAFISPYLRGEERDETDFMVAVIRSLARCNWPRHELVVDLHVEAPDRIGSSDFDIRWRNVLSNISTAFQPVRHLVHRIRIFAWPKLLNRYIFGGGVMEANGNFEPAGVRWGISTPHVARTGDAANVDPPFWHLLTSSEITPLHSKHYDNPPLRGPTDI